MNETQILAKAAAILEKRAAYNTKKDTFTSPEAVKRYLQMKFAAEYDGNERFVALFLDNHHRLIAAETLFNGTIDSAAVYPRVVVQKALQHNAAAIVFAHNHPSGTAEPSDADIRLTRKLVDALNLIEARVLDHVVVPDNSTLEPTSLAERGLM